MRTLARTRIIVATTAAALAISSCALHTQSLREPAQEDIRRVMPRESSQAVQASRYQATIPSYQHYSFNLTNGRGTLNVLVFDPTQFDLRVDITRGGTTAPTVAKKYPNAIAVTNGPYYDGLMPHLYLKSGGQAIVYDVASFDRFHEENIEAIFVIKGASASVIPRTESPESCDFALQGGPWLIRNGVDDTQRLPGGRQMRGSLKRTLLGITDKGQIILAAIAEGDGVSLPEAVQEMQARFKLRELMNLDGGPSTQMVIISSGVELPVLRLDVPAFLVVLPKQ